MPILAHLKPLIEAKSGGPTLQCDAQAMRDYLGFDPAEMRRDGYDPSTIELHEQFYDTLESYMEHPLIREYFTTLTPARSYQASGIGVATLRDILAGVFPEGGPDVDLFPQGFVPIGGSHGGNSVSFHFPSGRVIWADHERTSDIIEGDVQVLSEDIEEFLTDLLHDRLRERLDAHN